MVVILFCISELAFAQKEKIDDYYYIVPSESLFFDGYKSIKYEYQDSAGGLGMMTALRIFKDRKELLFVKDNLYEMFSFCNYLPYIKNDCYAQDINKDGHKEIIIEYNTGGGNCCEGAGYLYSLDDTAKLLLEMPPTEASFEIKDLEDDSIPEIIIYDHKFIGFFDYPFRAFMQRLIWRWDGSKYRIANMRFTKYYFASSDVDLTSSIENLSDTMTVVVDSMTTQVVPDFLFWDAILDYYFTGRPAQGDSIFNNYWPSIAPDKEIYHKELKKRIAADPYWPQILDSNW